MPRKLFKRLLPNPEEFKKKGALSALGNRIHDPNLWHLNKHSVAKAVAIGVFTAFLPVPGQMVIAAIFALIMYANLPIAVCLVWISNPLTIPPMFFATYKFGAWLLQVQPSARKMEFTMSWIQAEIGQIWQPLLVGSFISGLLSALLAYGLIRYFWRWHVIQNWNARKQKRQAMKKQRQQSKR